MLRIQTLGISSVAAALGLDAGGFERIPVVKSSRLAAVVSIPWRDQPALGTHLAFVLRTQSPSFSFWGESVRNAIIIAAITFASLWLASTWEFNARSAPTAPKRSVNQSVWRRTASGWERMSDWHTNNHHVPVAARVHPGLVASFVTLAAIGSLVAFSPASDRQSSG